ncbi:helix-turn-helix domain-containing protein [Rufibacter aurantiacus]|nr:helix-turn-helix domain-containing protein [Rufibacter aurantiacus]
MDNPFIVLDEKLSNLEAMVLEFVSNAQSLVLGLVQEKPMNIKEASEFLNIPLSTLYALTSRREIPHYKKGKHLLFYKAELNEWVREGRQRTVAEIQAEARKGVRLGK